MPIINHSSYQRPKFLFNRHLETILPSLIRSVRSMPECERIRISTDDNDFLDLDWYKHKSDRLLILSHGLEGDSQRMYIKGMVKRFHLAGWNVIAWNYRGCSGEMNGYFTIKIITVTFKQTMRADPDFDIQVTRRSTCHPGFAFARQPDPVTGIDTGRNFNRQGFGFSNTPFPQPPLARYGCQGVR